MSLPVIITPDAERDIAEAKAWYERKREGVSERFKLCVEAALEQIRRLPKGGTEVLPDVRRVVVQKFPYCVFYRVDSDQIAILAVYHSKRNPSGWQERLR